MKTPKKINFQFQGMTFELPANAIQKCTWKNNEPYIYMGAKNTASVIKQYVKKQFPNLKVWATSDVYSGGSSTRINVCNPDGSPVSEEIYNNIHSFSYNFKAGRFDGMTDCYEYREDEVMSENGTKFDYFPSYIFVENKATWGSFEYWLNEFNTFDPTNYSRPVVGETKWEQFWNFNKSYMKDSQKMLKTFTDYYTRVSLS